MPRAKKSASDPAMSQLAQSIRLSVTGSGLSVDSRLIVLVSAVASLVASNLSIDPLDAMGLMSASLSRAMELRKEIAAREKNRTKVARRRAVLKRAPVKVTAAPSKVKKRPGQKSRKKK